MSEREQFEAWFSDGGKYPHAVERSGEGYVFAAANSQWEAWQASREALKAEQAGDGWIACADRMPENGVKVLCFPEGDEPIHAIFNGQLWLQDVSWSVSPDPIDNVIPTNVTHWMPLPSPPATNHPIDTTPNQYDALGKGERQ